MPDGEANMAARGRQPGRRAKYSTIPCVSGSVRPYLLVGGDPDAGRVMHHDLYAPVPQLKLGWVGADDIQGSVLLVPERANAAGGGRDQS